MKSIEIIGYDVVWASTPPIVGYDGWPITDDLFHPVSMVSRSALEVCAVLLEHADSVRDTLDCFGRTALHYAARGGHAEA